MFSWKQTLQRIFIFNQYERDSFVREWAAKLAPGSKVLDIGAGPCRYRPLFSHCNYYAQDFAKYEGSTQGSLADEGRWSYGKLDFISDATAIPAPDGSFDAVLCTEVLEHVAEPIVVVYEISRILRPGGRVLMAAPLGSGLHQEPYHYYGGYTPYWYRKFLTEAGFTEIQVMPNGGFFKHYGQESQRFSAFIDPRRVSGRARYLLAPLWLLTLPWFRGVLPLTCHYLDYLDSHKGFTVGYHVTAVRKPLKGEMEMNVLKLLCPSEVTSNP
jgi:ubiquinone/menaquinone biosynthesis C-methylase UbiE